MWEWPMHIDWCPPSSAIKYSIMQTNTSVKCATKINTQNDKWDSNPMLFQFLGLIAKWSFKSS